MNNHVVRLLAAFTLVIAVAACSTAPTATPSPSAQGGTAVSIRTPAQNPQACMDALFHGTLARHAQTGLGIAEENGVVVPVEWPFRYSARMDGARIVLLDDRGIAVAREGDRIQVGGGMGSGPGPNAVWFACGGVTVTRAAS